MAFNEPIKRAIGFTVNRGFLGVVMSHTKPKFSKKLLWSEDFKGAKGRVPSVEYHDEKSAGGKLKRKTDWNVSFGDGSVDGPGAGWGNNEKEFYTDQAVTLDGSEQGNLVLTARKTDSKNGPQGWQSHPDWAYVSGKLTTADKLSFKYGLIEARIKLPTELGSWSAFWMLGDGLLKGVAWPQCGEIDILEAVGQEPKSLLGTIHGPGYFGDAGITQKIHHSKKLSSDFHTYAILWSPNKIQWLFDGEVYHTLSKSDVAPNDWVFNQNYYMIINLAMGGTLGGNLDPNVTVSKMKVDYIKYYAVKIENAKSYLGKLTRH